MVVLLVCRALLVLCLVLPVPCLVPRAPCRASLVPCLVPLRLCRRRCLPSKASGVLSPDGTAESQSLCGAVEQFPGVLDT